MRAPSRRRGTALLQVLILLLVAITVVALLITASAALTKQTKAHQENTVVRNEGRGSVHLVAAKLDREIQAGTPLVPPGGAWVGSGTPTDPYYMVLVGSLRHRPAGDPVTTSLRPWCEVDAAQTYYTFVAASPPGTSVGTSAWVRGARDFLRARPAGDLTFLARVEYKADASGLDFYYHTRCVTRVASGVVGDAISAGVGGVGGDGPSTVLVVQAALVPEIPTPWSYAGFRGNRAVRVANDGNISTTDGGDGNVSAVLASNGSIGR